MIVSASFCSDQILFGIYEMQVTRLNSTSNLSHYRPGYLRCAVKIILCNCGSICVGQRSYTQQLKLPEIPEENFYLGTTPVYKLFLSDCVMIHLWPPSLASLAKYHATLCNIERVVLWLYYELYMYLCNGKKHVSEQLEGAFCQTIKEHHCMGS